MKSAALNGFVALAMLFRLTAADWQYKSRPDLAPPRLNITIPANTTNKDGVGVEKGYLFMAPFAGYPDTPTEQHGPRQAAPYIYRDDGDLVWSGYGYYKHLGHQLPGWPLARKGCAIQL